MSSAWLEKCCCCIPLSIGSFILGYVLTIIDFGLSSLSVFNVVKFIGIMQEYSLNDIRMKASIYMCIAVAVINFLAFIVCIALLVGLHTRKRGLLDKFCKIYPSLMAAYYLIALIMLSMNGYYYDLKLWLLQCIDLTLLLLQSYTVFVIFRRAKELKTEADRDGGGVKLSAVGNINVPNDQNYA